MFDVGFSELVVLAIVALLVIGPERLPKVARTVGVMLGRMQRYVNDVKADIHREMELDEFKKLHTSIENSAREIESSFSRELADAGSEFASVQQTVQDALADTSAAPAPASIAAPAEPNTATPPRA